MGTVNARWALTVISRPPGSKGWVKLPIRWVVERTFAWLGRCRRLSKDRERSVLSSGTFVRLAMIHLMLRRLRPGEKDAPFRYKRTVGVTRLVVGRSCCAMSIHR